MSERSNRAIFRKRHKIYIFLAQKTIVVSGFFEYNDNKNETGTERDKK